MSRHVDIGEHAAELRSDDLAIAADIGAHDRQALRGGLEQHHRQALPARRQDEPVCGGRAGRARPIDRRAASPPARARARRAGRSAPHAPDRRRRSPAGRRAADDARDRTPRAAGRSPSACPAVRPSPTGSRRRRPARPGSPPEPRAGRCARSRSRSGWPRSDRAGPRRSRRSVPSPPPRRPSSSSPADRSAGRRSPASARPSLTLWTVQMTGIRGAKIRPSRASRLAWTMCAWMTSGIPRSHEAGRTGRTPSASGRPRSIRSVTTLIPAAASSSRYSAGRVIDSTATGQPAACSRAARSTICRWAPPRSSDVMTNSTRNGRLIAPPR